jgi:hypothetical protein
VLAAPSAAAASEPEPEVLEPEEAVQDIGEAVDTPGGFAPPGWVVETQTTGRIDGDGIDDIVLQLIQRDRPMPSDAPPITRNRILVVALGKAGAGYRRVGIGAHLLQCTTCGGALYMGNAPPSDVKLDKGSIVVMQEAGSRVLSTQTWKLRCNAGCSRIVLYQEIDGERDRVEGISSSTETDWGANTKTIRTYRASTPGGREVLVSTKTQPAKGAVYLEDIDYTNR